jgi:hypothetical protein
MTSIFKKISFQAVFVFLLFVLAGAGCGSPKVAQNVEPEEEGPPMPKQGFSIKAQDGGAIALKPADGSRIKIVFPQGSLESDSDLEVAERPDSGEGVLSYGFSLNRKGGKDGPELKYPALLVFSLDKEVSKDASIVRYTSGGSYEVIPTRVSSKDGKTLLIAQVDHFSDYGARQVEPEAIQSAKDSQGSADFNWVIYAQDSYDIDSGAMKRKVTLDFKAVNTSGDIAGEYKGYAHAQTSNKMDIGSGGVTADSQVKDDNVSFSLEPYVELAPLVERDDDLADLEPEKLPDLMGQGSLNMSGSGGGTVSARGYTYGAGLKVQDSHDAMTVVVTGPLVRLTVTVNGIGTMYFDGYIRGEGR